MKHAGASYRVLLVTSAALFALWGVSFGLSYVHLGGLALPLALTFASVKAILVLLVFMELAYSRFTVGAAVVSAGALAALLLAFMIADIATRGTPELLPPGAGR